MATSRICLALPCALLCALLSQSGPAAQTPTPNTDSPAGLLARLSYDNSYVDGVEQPISPLTCFEVYRNGRYRLSRYRNSGFTSGAETLAGALSQDDLSSVAKMLKMLDFDNHQGTVVRQGAETFAAEVVRGKQTVRYVWVNPDHHRPFPDSAVSIITWLREFTPQGASPLTVPEGSPDPICPRMADDPMQPIH